MHAISETMQAALDAGVTTYCRALRVERGDGAQFGFTDHDQDMEIDGLLYRADQGFTLTALDQQADLNPGAGEIIGRLSAIALDHTSLAAGLWTAARLTLWLVDWQNPDDCMALASGRLGEVRVRDGQFEADWLGPAEPLNRRTGRVFSRACDASLGDTRCAVAPTHPAFARGCDKHFATCRDRFENSQNFRGFPYLIGNDVLIAGASGEAVRDGGRREVSE